METSGQERKGLKLRALCKESKSKPEQKGPEVISLVHALKSFPGRSGWPGPAMHLPARRGELRHLLPLAFWVGGSYQKWHNHYRHIHFSPKGKRGTSRKGNGSCRTNMSTICSSQSQGSSGAWGRGLSIILLTTIPTFYRALAAVTQNSTDWALRDHACWFLEAGGPVSGETPLPGSQAASSCCVFTGREGKGGSPGSPW